nr:MAG TPA: hypothetical protein [Caudoviricetes sp.]
MMRYSLQSTGYRIYQFLVFLQRQSSFPWN